MEWVLITSKIRATHKPLAIVEFKNFWCGEMKYFFFKILVFVCLVTSANGATIKRHEANSYGCTITLEGVIASGDSEIIKPLLFELYEISLSDEGLYGETLCLNSPGGDLNEGIKIANYVSEYYTTTVVAAGARCESSCAVIFLAGRYSSIDPRGAIGLHAPKLILPKGSFSEEDVMKAYDLSVYTTREIMKMPTFPPAGVRHMMSTPHSEMYIPKTFFELSELGVELSSLDIPRQFPLEQKMENACRWAVWTIGGANYFINPDEREIKFVSFTGVSSNSDELKISAEFSVHDAEETYYPCNVKLGFDKDRSTGELYFFSTSVSTLGQEVFLDRTQIYPPNASYLDIYLLPELSPDQFIAMAKSVEKENLQKIECSIMEPKARIVNVSDFTNLRANAGINALVISEVPLSATVTLPTPGRYLASNRCIDACSAGVKPQVKQCIDSNEVWIEVEYNNVRGTLSRKFLEAEN